MSHQKRAELLEAAKAFCSDFASFHPPEEIITSHFSSSDDILALEHGLPQLAPFLGRDFKGQKGVREYFHIISSCLKYEDMKFGNYVVDAMERKASVKGEAKFTWLNTGQNWDEVFTYVLEFTADLKVRRYEIWADSGAAYLASKGLLL